MIAASVSGRAAAQPRTSHQITIGAWDVYLSEENGAPIRCLTRSIDAAAAGFDVFWVYDLSLLANLPEGQLVADPRLLPVGGEAQAIIDDEETVDLVQGLDGFIRVAGDDAARLASAMRDGYSMLIQADGDDDERRDVLLSLVGFTAASRQAKRLCDLH